ncbi:pyridine nucleotide-disulfide oxidoreductase [Oscillatoriales cyanobacterium USR001]|nr:pyridine nucleotide-disulfide oxidoreductase [Oscillatoriales cyanobacterium USR001]
MEKINGVKNLVLIGGGHSHAIVLLMFGMKPLPGVRLTLISDVTHTPYSGMLPGHIAGFYNYNECHINLLSLSQFAQAQIFIDKAIALDLDKNQVICNEREPVNFDILSIDIGSTPNTLSVEGAEKYTTPAKPVTEFLTNWNQLIEQYQNHQNSLRIGIVGGGAGGVELALNMQSRLLTLASIPTKNLAIKSATKYLPEIHLFHRDIQLMTGHNQLVRRRLEKILIDRGIQLHLGETVCKIDKAESSFTTHNQLPITHYQLQCESGLKMKFNRIFWVTQAAAPNWIKTSGLSTDNQGFIQVNDYLQSVSHPQIFAAGDIATMINHPRPKAGVFAVRQGKPLFENLQRLLLGKPLKPFVPQKQYLGLIGTGNKNAIASRGSIMWESPLLWYWKNWLDRQFMKKFSNVSNSFPNRL